MRLQSSDVLVQRADGVDTDHDRPEIAQEHFLVCLTAPHEPAKEEYPDKYEYSGAGNQQRAGPPTTTR